jgi:hypothetical protein
LVNYWKENINSHFIFLIDFSRTIGFISSSTQLCKITCTTNWWKSSHWKRMYVIKKSFYTFWSIVCRCCKKSWYNNTYKNCSSTCSKWNSRFNGTSSYNSGKYQTCSTTNNRS